MLLQASIDAATTKVTDLFGGGYGLGMNLSGDGSTVPGQPGNTFGHGGLGGHISFGDAGLKMGFSCASIEPSEHRDRLGRCRFSSELSYGKKLC